MGETETFEGLDIWKKGCQLAVKVIADFHSLTIFSQQDQIQRSALSTPSNIAEGVERDSTADYIRFLRYSKASCGK